MASNPLTDVLPAKVRKYAYAALFVAAQGFAVYQAAGGDWKQFLGSEVAALLGLLAASNTPSSPKNENGSVEPGSLALGLFIGAVVAFLIWHH